MKTNISILFLFLALSFFSCVDKEQMKQLQDENVRLKTEAAEKDNIINDFMGSFNEIEDNLIAIKEKENIIRNTATSEELAPSAKDRINEDIISIYKLSIENKKKLNDLNEKLKKSNIKVAEFKKMVNSLTRRLEVKDQEINGLKNTLAGLKIDISNLNIEIDSLRVESEKKAQVISEQTVALNTAYYVLGSKKELKEYQILTKEGGFIGIGGINKIKGDFNKEYFTEIDIREVLNIPIGSKKIKIITSHPDGSYELKTSEKLTEELIIHEPKKFWSVSKYLVIMTD